MAVHQQGVHFVLWLSRRIVYNMLASIRVQGFCILKFLQHRIKKKIIYLHFLQLTTAFGVLGYFL